MRGSAAQARRIDFAGVRTYHRAPMKGRLPATIDAERAVQGRQSWRGELSLAALPRLAALLASTEGGVAYALEFGRSEDGLAALAVKVEGDLALTCQRSFEVFRYPVTIDQRLVLVADDAASLPPELDMLLVTDGCVRPVDVIEDELLLALPLVPLRPGEPAEWHTDDGDAESTAGPFAALARLKHHH
ncbi:MAG: YceD family protein [Lysobacterales bacterium]